MRNGNTMVNGSLDSNKLLTILEIVTNFKLSYSYDERDNILSINSKNVNLQQLKSILEQHFPVACIVDKGNNTTIYLKQRN